MAEYEYLIIAREHAERNPPTTLKIELHRQENVSTLTKRIDYTQRLLAEYEHNLGLWQAMEGKDWEALTSEQRDTLLGAMILAGDEATGGGRVDGYVMKEVYPGSPEVPMHIKVTR